MKKITATLLILAMMTTAFAACSNDETEESTAPTVAPEESVEPTLDPDLDPNVSLGDPEDVTPEVDVDETPEEEMADPKTEFDADLSQKYYDAVDASRTEDQKQGTDLLTSTDPTAFPDYDLVMSVMGFSSHDVEAYAIGMTFMNVHAYCVAAVKPVEGSEQKILDGFEAYRQDQYDNFTNYLADQQAIAENAIIETLDDGTILFVMAENQQEVFDGIAASLAQ